MITVIFHFLLDFFLPLWQLSHSFTYCLLPFLQYKCHTSGFHPCPFYHIYNLGHDFNDSQRSPGVPSIFPTDTAYYNFPLIYTRIVKSLFSTSPKLERSETLQVHSVLIHSRNIWVCTVYQDDVPDTSNISMNKKWIKEQFLYHHETLILLGGR